jgi:hypothetical protein
MPTITPGYDTALNSQPRLIWEGIATGDTIVAAPLTAASGVLGAVQVTGAFGGATVTLECSNDGATWYPVNNRETASGSHAAISFTSAGFAEFYTAAALVRPAITGGTDDDVDVVVVLRGTGW